MIKSENVSDSILKSKKEQAAPRKYKRIVKFSSKRVEFSDGSVLTTKTGEFDEAIIKMILEAGE